MDREHRPLQRVGVFCGSHPGTEPAYRKAAVTLGELLVARGLGLVYGGGNVGLMGILADAVLAGGGEVIGVIPRSLQDREVAHEGLSELLVVESMHERKLAMYERADAVAALPGGIGTFEELFEAFTWNQLELHFKPAGLLNVGGYYDPLVTMLDRAVEHGFLRPAHRGLITVASDPGDLLDRLAAIRPSDHAGHWVRPPYAAELRGE